MVKYEWVEKEESNAEFQGDGHYCEHKMITNG